MTRELTPQQKNWTERVDRYLEGCEAVSVGGCPGCEECGIPEDAENYESNSWFSWSPCEICGGLAGDRQAWHCIINDKIVHGSCCPDCVCYIANGDVPDIQGEDDDNEN